ncbi:emopamil-binding family protein [Zavarzinia compransoris]|uniref:emopamil-binding family protein n=1 Tax=Zavarzinia marina TaxID=2911065 RepID=UPI001F3A2640|nr:emopamil-binding family protein [Zavarzinia marina]MCF4164563.1 emopamil-binding family protein [Zavarzinia marina]
MRELHPNLGRGATGLRLRVYQLSLFLTLVFAGGAFALVALGVIPGTPIDIYSSWVILAVLFVPFIALMDGAGEKRTTLEKWSEFGFVWLLVSGIAQTFWELPWFFLDLTGVVHGIGPEDGHLWAWWVYGGADTRYITSNPTIAGLEFMAGFSGPFELYAWYLYKRGANLGDKIGACWMALIIGVGLTYMTGVFFVAEWHVGWANIQQGALGFWLKFVGLNVPWIVAPVIALPAAIMELAHLYRVDGYETARREMAATPARRRAVG